MLKAVLFDIDNTLILFDEAQYFQSYLKQLARVFADLIPVNQFSQKLLAASQALLYNEGTVSNAEYFMREFSIGIPAPRPEIWERFIRFYENDYDQFQSLVTVPPGVREVLETLLKMKMQLVIASNPMFPEMIQLKRLSWAGLDDLPYALITHVENMSYCKPRLEYYQQICQKIATPPEACLMVGNDPMNDMIVNKIGMKTFLTLDGQAVDDSALSLSRELRAGNSEEIPTPDFKGPLLEVPQAVAQLLNKQSPL